MYVCVSVVCRYFDYFTFHIFAVYYNILFILYIKILHIYFKDRRLFLGNPVTPIDILKDSTLVYPPHFLPQPHFWYQENIHFVKRRRLVPKLLYFPPFPSPSFEAYYRIYKWTLAVTRVSDPVLY